MAPAKYNPLDEPSPLGLSLKKSPSLLELIQMKITHCGDPKAAETLKAGALGSGLKRESKTIAAAASVGPTLAPGSIEKLKASNFPASLLKIGQWEVSPAKCFVLICFHGGFKI
jgi:hypothetical protein